jgi:hypothetical protein
MASTPTITPTAIPDGPRRRTPASTRLLHEWSLLQPWVAGPWYELRLGPTPLVATGAPITPEMEASLRAFNRYSDLVGVTATELWVVEAKMVAEPGALSQLQHYVELVYSSPVYAQYPQKVIQGILVWAVDDPIIHTRAASYGFRVDVFTPDWVQTYLGTRFYHR